MKKIFTSFLMLMLCAISMNAQYKPSATNTPAEGVSYLLGTSVDGTDYFVTYKGAMQAAASDNSYLWQIEATGETTSDGQATYYLKSGDTGLYIQEYDQVKLLQGLDGYDIFGYAGFNFEMGEKASAMAMTLDVDNDACTLTRAKTVDLSGYDYPYLRLKYQSNGGVNVAMDPWGVETYWYFYSYEGKTVFDLLADLAEQCDYYQFVAGTTFGYYDAEKVAAFEAAREAAHNADGDPDLNDEAAQKLYDNLKAALEAVQTSFICIPAGIYRVVSGLEKFAQNQGEEAVKAMYDKEGTAMWKNVDAEEASMLWSITPDESDAEAYTFVNAYTGRQYSTVGQSANITLTDAQAGVLTMIEIAGYNEAGVVKFDIRPTSSSRGGYGYVHCGGHSGGDGVSGNLVGWCNTFSNGEAGASEWELYAVSAEEAQAIIDAQSKKDDKGALIAAMQELINKAQNRYYATGTYTQGDALITDAGQFSSNATEPNEGSIEALIDGDASTFWHSKWSGGSVPGNSHYLEVALTEPVDQLIELYVMRRTASDDHVTKSDVYGSVDGENWTYLTQLTLGNARSGLEYTSTPFEAKGYSHLRFWITDTYYSGGSTRGYGHYAEFQLYTATMDDDCQLAKIMNEEVAKNLVEAIATAKAIAEPTQADIDALQAAYDAFVAISADPSALEALITTVETRLGSLPLGTNPGFYSEEQVDAIAVAVDAAKALLESGNYTQQQLDEQQAALQAVYETLTPNKPDPAKWYNLRVNFSDVDYFISAEKPSDEAGVDNKAKVWSSANITDPQQSQWRFIPVDEKNYILQNRATGMSLYTVSTQNYAFATYQAASTFAFAYASNGSIALWATSAAAASHGYMVCYGSSYDDMTLGSYGTSGYNLFFVEEVEVDDESTLTTNVELADNAFTMLVSPFGVDAVGDAALAFDVLGTNEEDGTLSLLLKEATSAPAGTPIIILCGDESGEYNAETKVSVPVTLGGNWAVEAQATEQGLTATYSAIAAEVGSIIVKNGRFAVAEAGEAVSAYSAYIKPVATDATEYDNLIELEIPTSIEAALANVAKKGIVYNAAGQVVATDANLGDLKKLGRGTYILNGVKVMIK